MYESPIHLILIVTN